MGVITLFANASGPQTERHRVGMKHWGKCSSPRLMRNSSLNMALPSHMQAHAWRHTHTNTQTASPPPRHPCWHFGEKYPPPTPIYLPPLHPTSFPHPWQPTSLTAWRTICCPPPPPPSLLSPSNLLRLPAPPYPCNTSVGSGYHQTGGFWEARTQF